MFPFSRCICFELLSVFQDKGACACPLKQMAVNTTDTEVAVPTLGPIANLLGTGHYVVKAHLLDANNTPFFCVDIDMHIE